MKISLKKWRWHLLWAVPITLVLLALLWRALTFEGPYLTPQALPLGATVDIHTHVAGVGAGNSGCYLSKELREGSKLGPYLKGFGLDLETVQVHGDRVVVERLAKWVDDSKFLKGAVVLAIDGVVTDGALDLEKTEIYVPNEFVVREIAQYPKLTYGAGINPHRKDALERLAKAKEDGAVLVKWIPSIQNIDPADPALTPFYRKMVELGLPLLSHTGQERAFTRADDRLGDPQRLKLPLDLGVTVIAAHAASTGTNEGQDNLDRLLPMFQTYPRLFADISSLTQVNKLGYLKRVLRDRRARGRLIYGSDFPLMNTPLVSPFYFLNSLTWARVGTVRSFQNPFDRDIALKQALGVPADTFLHPFGQRAP